MSFLVDSDYIIDALRGTSETLDTLDALAQDGLSVSYISLGEV